MKKGERRKTLTGKIPWRRPLPKTYKKIKKDVYKKKKRGRG
jgi:hypothetical protein